MSSNSKIQNHKSNIVFVHGAGPSSDYCQWHRPACLNAHYLDLPGHGTDGGRWTVDGGRSLVEDYTDWVANYIETNSLRDVVLSGHSMGGAITLTLALRRPEWLRAIVLTGTGARLRVSP